MKTIMDDTEEILSIALEDGVYTVGDSIDSIAISKIKPYEENGEMAKVVWFAVYFSDYTIAARVNGKYVTAIHYKVKWRL